MYRILLYIHTDFNFLFFTLHSDWKKISELQLLMTHYVEIDPTLCYKH